MASTAIRASSAAVFRPLESGGVVLNVETGDYYELNGTGRFLWERVQEGADPDAMASALGNHYGIDPTTAEADVGSFLDDLRKRRLVEA